MGTKITILGWVLEIAPNQSPPPPPLPHTNMKVAIKALKIKSKNRFSNDGF